MASHVSGVFLNTEHFAETFAHTNPTVDGDPDDITGVLDEDPSSPPLHGDAGDRTVRTGTLFIPDTVTVSVVEQRQSRFVRGDETWYATSVSIAGDLQEVRVKLGTLHTGRQGVRSGAQPR